MYADQGLQTDQRQHQAVGDPEAQEGRTIATWIRRIGRSLLCGGCTRRDRTSDWRSRTPDASLRSRRGSALPTHTEPSSYRPSFREEDGLPSPKHLSPPFPIAAHAPIAARPADEATVGLNATSVAAMFEGLAQAIISGGMFNSAQTINVNITVNAPQVALGEQGSTAVPPSIP